MARWQVKAAGWEQQGSLDFAGAVDRAVTAHRRGDAWDAQVHDGTSWRILNDNEAAKLVAAIAKELT